MYFGIDWATGIPPFSKIVCAICFNYNWENTWGGCALIAELPGVEGIVPETATADWLAGLGSAGTNEAEHSDCLDKWVNVKQRTWCEVDFCPNCKTQKGPQNGADGPENFVRQRSLTWRSGVIFRLNWAPPNHHPMFLPSDHNPPSIIKMSKNEGILHITTLLRPCKFEGL